VWNGTTNVALKEINNYNIEEFKHEASILQSLASPYIVQFLGIFQDKKKGQQYLVTEYLAKGSLLSLLQRESNTITDLDLLVM
jgi:serine/threonine protein kinase